MDRNNGNAGPAIVDREEGPCFRGVPASGRGTVRQGMELKKMRGAQRGATQVEYAIVIAGVSLAVMAAVGLLGGSATGGFCGVSLALGAGGCAQSAPDSGAAAPQGGTGSGSDGGDAGSGSSSGNAGAGSGASGGGTGVNVGSGDVGSGSGSGSGDVGTGSGSGSGDVSSDAGGTGTGSGSTEPAVTNSAGTMTFYTAVVDQDQRKRDLSARFNLGWFPESWSNVEYPETLTVDVTWTPALEVDQVITGSSGSWQYTLVAPGHLRLTRTGDLTTSGFTPEPQILLVKPDTTQNVTVTFTASAPNTPAISGTSTTIAVPYK